MGKSVKCEVAFDEENFQGSNATYVSGEKARSDITVDMAGRGNTYLNTYLSKYLFFCGSGLPFLMFQCGKKMLYAEIGILYNEFGLLHLP